MVYGESARQRIETRMREWAVDIVHRLQELDGGKFPTPAFDYNRALSLTSDNLEELRLDTALFHDELARVYELTGAPAEGPELTPDSQPGGHPAAAAPIGTSNSFEPLSDTASDVGSTFQTPPRSGAGSRFQKTPPRNHTGSVFRCVWSPCLQYIYIHPPFQRRLQLRRSGPGSCTSRRSTGVLGTLCRR